MAHVSFSFRQPLNQDTASSPLLRRGFPPTIHMIEMPDLERISARLRDAGGMLMLHAEDNTMAEERIASTLQSGGTTPIYHARSKPPEVENAAIRSAIEMTRETGGRTFIVHMTTAEGTELIPRARAEGIDVITETCTHYLIFTNEVLKRPDGIKWICSPPLRDASHQDVLWQGIRDGRISQVTSDDAAYSWDAKQVGKDRFDQCPNGIPGIEPRLHLLYSEGVVKGRLSLPRFVELIASAPAKLFGLSPRKGTLAPGSDADIVLFDPNVAWEMNHKTLHMNTDWSAYEGIEITGKIQRVFSRGDLIIDGDQCLAEKGRGQYLHRTLNFDVHY